MHSFNCCDVINTSLLHALQALKAQIIILLIIIIMMTYIAHVSTNFWCSRRITLLPLLIRRINHSWNHLSSLGSIQLNCCHYSAYRANQTQQPTLPSQVPIYSWEERSNYSKVSCSSTLAARIRTHILTTQPSEHKSDALNCLAMTLHVPWRSWSIKIYDLILQTPHMYLKA